ncbi:MAG: molybdopterin-dependent oxidoreductase [Thermoleophilia bacterium]|nr:molybdopterin-dependent oxidoreductase [Thermoleophilia bacterium]
MHRRILVPALIIALLATLGALGCGSGVDRSAAAETGGSATTATTSAPATTDSTASSISTTTTVAPADLEPVVVPGLPADIPGYTEVDPATGLHVTGEPVVVELATYRLKVGGKVAKELSLTYDDVRRLPKVTASPLLNCPGFFTDQATWSGASLKAILEMAGVQPDAERIKMKSADGYSISLTLENALRTESFLAYELMGETLPVLHGFPLRAVIPGKDGNLWVKWLVELTVE